MLQLLRISSDVLNFLRDRIKNLLREKKIRNDIIEAAVSLHKGDEFLSLYKKCLIVNKNISKGIGKDIVGTYKRASSIIDQEVNKRSEKILGQPNAVLFNKKEEKLLLEKIYEIRKYFLSAIKEESYDQTLKILGERRI